ncbi:hypothetical protein U1Q18_004725 [Sarracenia purpurea var. burkii]
MHMLLRGEVLRPDCFGNEVQAKYQFAKTHSSSDLTDTSSQFSSRRRHNGESKTTKRQTATRLHYSNGRDLEVSENSNAILSTKDPPFSRQSSLYAWTRASVESNGASYGCRVESDLVPIEEDRTSIAEALQMQQEEQGFVNTMAFLQLQAFIVLMDMFICLWI